MIKDFIFKLLFIPLTGILIPIISGLITYSDFSTTQLIFSNLFFIISWYVTWQGNVYLIAHLRNRKSPADVFLKILFLCATAALFTGVIASFSAALWQQTYLPQLSYTTIIIYALSSGVFAIFITLIYEVLFLRKEVELDTKIVDQLDQERQHAEMSVLKNELDPHFIFNSLTALAHLINNNTEKAKLFTQKLAQAYKYLLMNKDRELISLEEELRFIDNYFFLLQIRHDHKLKLRVDIDESRDKRVMILPCALQILIENAIKHNQFTEAEPLVINIALNGVYLNVSNNVHSKPYMVESTNIGLKNLSTRYKLTCNKDIVINRAKEKFIVKLPIIQ